MADSLAPNDRVSFDSALECEPPPAKKARTQEVKDAAKATRQNNKAILDETREQLQRLTEQLEVGHSFDGKYTKESLFSAMPALLGRVNAKVATLVEDVDAADERGDILASALVGVMTQNYKKIMPEVCKEDEATVRAAVDARIEKLGIKDLMETTKKKRKKNSRAACESPA